MGARNIAAVADRRLSLASFIACLFLIFAIVARYVVSPLNGDEIYFAHSLWLVLHGQRQYVDFFSQHLPGYLLLARLVLPATGLNFIWPIRLSGLFVVLAYVALVVRLERRWWVLAPTLLYIFLARMIEIRSDTVGLLLMNCAWFALLRGRAWIAVFLGAAAAFFSARGCVMLVPLIAAAFSVDWRRTAQGVGIVCFVAAFAILMNFTLAQIIFRSAFLDPVGFVPPPAYWTRFLGPSQLPIVAALMTALYLRRNTIIVIAVAGQLALIAFDPAPFEYVYGWSLVPCIVGLAPVAIWAEAVGMASCVVLTALALSYPFSKGKPAPVGSPLRLTISFESARVPSDLAQLVQDSLAPPTSLSSQLTLRGELCRRLSGKVLSVWESHPICLSDANYYWHQLKWPGVWEGEGANAIWFNQALDNRDTKLFIWAPEYARTPNAETRAHLNGYQLYPGFALRRPSVSSPR